MPTRVVVDFKARLFVRADGLEALTSGSDGQVRLWDLATLQLKGTLGAPDGKQLALGYGLNPVSAVVVAEKDCLVLREAPSGLELKRWKPHGTPISAAWMDPSTGRALAQVGDETWFWDLAAGKGKALQADPKLVPRVAAIQPGQDRYAFGLASSVGVRAVRASKTRWLQNGEWLGATALAWAPGGGWFIRGSKEGTVGIHEGDSRVYSSLISVHAAPVIAAFVSKDHQKAITVSRDGAVKRWDLSHFKRLDLETEWKAAEAIVAAALAPDGRLLLSTKAGQLVWSNLGW
jgi:WD40 repeat protein